MTDSKSEADVDRLKQWFRNNGGYLSDAIDIVYQPNYGYHYIAKSKAVEVQETVCTCPFSLTLSHLNVLSSPPAGIRNCSDESICSVLVGKVDDSTIAAFFLVEQRLKGSASFWFPYMQLLPDENEMTTPLWFEDGSGELAYLQGTNLLPKNVPREDTSIGLRESMYKKQWQSGVTELQKAGKSTDEYTWRRCLWAATVLSSRAFTSNIFTASTGKPSFSVLYPVIDTFNHRYGAKVQWKLDSGSFSLCLEERIAQGQQIFNNYAPKGNEELLMGYGFCVLNNPCDQVAFRLGQVPPAIHARLRNRVPIHWKSETWNPEESVFYIRGKSHYTGGYPNTYGIVALDCLRGIPPELANSVHEIVLAMEGNAINAGETEDNMQIWAGAADVVLQRAETVLGAIAESDSELPDSPTSAGAKAASIYRAGQVRILEEVISELTEFLETFAIEEGSDATAFHG